MPAHLGIFILFLLLAPSASSAQELPLFAPLSAGTVPAPTSLDGKLPTPQDVLGYSLGERFTPHHRLLDYLERLADASDRVQLVEYGRTYEDRPLVLLAISNPENLARLEQLRRGNLRLADPSGLPAEARADLLGNQPVVVWLAFGVHGNETSSAEAALGVAFVLAASQGEQASQLDNMVVLIDPLVNPDGRERFVHWYKTERGRVADPYHASREHWEPWPGGRQNHYLIDLNRDWTWLSQQETQQRLAAYRRWEPQVYVDFHEMGQDSNYFFPPPADPVLEVLDPRQLAFLETFGRANGAAFDRQGWLYYVRQVFDLFYPGYGDTYPLLRGAVGMTYEVGGGGGAGADLLLPDGRRLTLADRVARHFTTALATLETAQAHRQELLRDFVGARERENSTTYLWSSDQAEASALAQLLVEHGVRVEQLTGEVRLEVRSLLATADVTRTFSAGTFVASANQPLGGLLQTLMDAEQPLPPRFLAEQRRRVESQQEPNFFDITAWSLPLAFNLQAFTTQASPSALRPYQPALGGNIEGAGGVGWLIPPQGLSGYRLTAHLLRRDVRLHRAGRGFRIAGRDYPAGTLFVPRLGNPDELGDDLNKWVQEGVPSQDGTLVQDDALQVMGVATSMAEDGVSLGSDDFHVIQSPRIGLLGGRGVSPTSHGFVWHLFEEGVGLAHSRLPIDRLKEIDLADFDALVLPAGDGYSQLLQQVGEQIENWVRSGGVLVGMGSAREWLQGRGLSKVEAWQAMRAPHEPLPNNGDFVDLSQQKLLIPGAILATDTSPSHPLTAGILDAPPVLFFGSEIWRSTGDPQVDLLTVRPDRPRLAGFAWPEGEERLRGALLASAEKVESGQVILFSQNPAYRLFWRGTMPLFLDAVLFGPSL